MNIKHEYCPKHLCIGTVKGNETEKPNQKKIEKKNGHGNLWAQHEVPIDK